MAEKSEKATPKKLRDARKKGQVAKAQDFPSAATFIVSIALLLFTSNYIYNQLASFLVNTFKLVPYLDMNAQIGSLMGQSISTIAKASLPIFVATAFIGVLVNFLLVGPMFSVEVFKPNFKKFNPVENIKQKFKLRTLIELLKSIFKITGAAVLIYLVMRNDLVDIILTVSLPLVTSALVFHAFLLKIVLRVGIFFLAIALFDLIYQRKSFAKEMMMEKFEVKQEYKDTEGSPEIKSRRRHIAQEIAYDESGPNVVKRAKALITNPLHIAVALGYEPEKYPAPFILAMGVDNIAALMIQAAVEHNVPIMRNVPLARELFETGKVMEYIPKDTYEAVAEVLRWIASLEQEPPE